MKVLFLIIITVAAAALTPGQALSEDAVKLVGAVGIESAEVFLKNKKMEIPKSKLEPGQTKKYLEAVISAYAEEKNGLHERRNYVKWTKIGFINRFPNLAIFNPFIDLAIDKDRQRSDRVVLEYLALIKDRLVSDSTLGSYDALRKDPALFRRLLSEGKYFSQDFKKRLDDMNDPILSDFVIDVLLQAGMGTDEAQWIAMREIETGREKLEAKLFDIVKDFQTLKAYVNDSGGKVGSLKKDVLALQEITQEVNARLQSMDDDIGLIAADFMLSRMSASKKVKALEEGFMADRLTPEDRKLLIKEAKAQDRLASLQIYQESIGHIATIAHNLSYLDLDPEAREVLSAAQKVLAVGQIVGNAAAQIAVLGPWGALGALASLTGLFQVFSDIPDPDTKRFEITMEHFGILDEKIDAVLENQKQIFDALIKISEYTIERFDAIDQRQFNMYFEQRRISSLVRFNHWKGWRSCNNVYEAALKRDSSGRNMYTQADTGLFVSFDAIATIAGEQTTDFRECYKEASAALGSIGAISWFGNFADARSLNDELRSVPDGTLLYREKENAERWRSDLQTYIEDIFDPTIRLVLMWSEEKNIASDTLFSSQTWPRFTLDGARQALDAARNDPLRCFTKQAIYGGTHDYLCQRPDRTSREVALDAITTPLVADSLVDIADWILVISQMADIYDQDTRNFPRDISRIDGRNLGRPMIEKTVDLLNMGVATYNVVYGYPAIEAIKSAFRRGDATAHEAVEILNSNRYVAANFVISMLHERYKEHARLQGGSEKKIVDIYSAALKALVDAGVDVPLRNLFGTDVFFIVEKRKRAPLSPFLGDPGRTRMGQPSIRMRFAEGIPDITIPLPMPTAFIERRVVYPPKYDEMVAKRDQIMSRLAFYRLTDGLDDAELEEFVAIFLANR